MENVHWGWPFTLDLSWRTLSRLGRLGSRGDGDRWLTGCYWGVLCRASRIAVEGINAVIGVDADASFTLVCSTTIGIEWAGPAGGSIVAKVGYACCAIEDFRASIPSMVVFIMAIISTEGWTALMITLVVGTFERWADISARRSTTFLETCDLSSSRSSNKSA